MKVAKAFLEKIFEAVLRCNLQFSPFALKIL